MVFKAKSGLIHLACMLGEFARTDGGDTYTKCGLWTGFRKSMPDDTECTCKRCRKIQEQMQREGA